MGANAQTSVPAFTAGQVLTAQQQTEINTGIPVFATTTTRDAAFGGTGEKTLAEGQFAYIEASDTTQYYDGTTWQTVGATPGLRYITGNSFSAVSSFSLPNDTFTTTYRNYRLYMEITSASTDLTVTARMRQSGADNTSSNYYFEQMGWSVAALTQTNQATTATSWTMAQIFTANYGYGQIIIDITSPKLAQRTLATGTTIIAANSSHWGQSIAGMIFSSTNQFDAMSFICNTGNFTGVYRVYGYSES